MDIDETKQVKLKDKPMMTLLEAAEFTGIGRHILRAKIFKGLLVWKIVYQK